MRQSASSATGLGSPTLPANATSPQLNDIVRHLCSSKGERWKQIKDYATLKALADKKAPSLIFKADICLIALFVGMAVLMPNYAPALLLVPFALTIGIYGRYQNNITEIKTAQELEGEAVTMLKNSVKSRLRHQQIMDVPFPMNVQLAGQTPPPV